MIQPHVRGELVIETLPKEEAPARHVAQLIHFTTVLGSIVVNSLLSTYNRLSSTSQNNRLGSRMYLRTGYEYVQEKK